MGKYFKAAFLNHWNLLAFISTTAFALISGRPDILLPLVLAGETAYLALLGTHPKFRKAIDAQDAAAARQSQARSTTQVLAQIMKNLPRQSLDRFERLRAQCYELHQIAADLKHSAAAVAGAPLESLQMAGLDRLLWIFLRLLYTQVALSKFLQRTSADQIEKDIRELERRLAETPAGDESLPAAKIRRALEDNLQTSRERLENHQKAKTNHELVELELDRLENKIKSLAEVAVNRAEPEFISNQVDAVAGSMRETERTMNDLQFATGLAAIEEEVPDLLRPAVAQVVK